MRPALRMTLALLAAVGLASPNATTPPPRLRFLSPAAGTVMTLGSASTLSVRLLLIDADEGSLPCAPYLLHNSAAWSGGWSGPVGRYWAEGRFPGAFRAAWDLSMKRFPLGDHRLVALCLTAEQLNPHVGGAVGENDPAATAVDRVLKSALLGARAGRTETHFAVRPRAGTPPVAFTQAQAYVSGGATLGPPKWRRSGLRQFHLLRRLGLRTDHAVLEVRRTPPPALFDRSAVALLEACHGHNTASVGVSRGTGRLQLAVLSHLVASVVVAAVASQIGCGTLNLARFLLPFLRPGAYACVEPNTWLREAAVAAHPELAVLLARTRPRFLANAAFDARPLLPRRFDWVFSHSILSHAAHWQLPLYLRHAAAVLRPSGVGLASLMFHTAHQDPTVAAGDSMDESWVYPWSARPLPAPDYSRPVEPTRSPPRTFAFSSAPPPPYAPRAHAVPRVCDGRQDHDVCTGHRGGRGIPRWAAHR